MTAARKHRGMRSQALIAAWFRDHGFPYATDAGSGRPGRDLLNLMGLAGEVKARAGFSPLSWIKQATKTAAGDLPFVVFRCNCRGPQTVGDWPVIVRLEDFTDLIRSAGYGDDAPHVSPKTALVAVAPAGPMAASTQAAPIATGGGR